MAKYCPVTGKVKHASAETAARAVSNMTSRHGPSGHPYLCSHCNAWHHTKGQQKTGRQRAYRRELQRLSEPEE